MESQLVTAGDVGDVELLDDPRGHGALSGCRGAEDDGPENRGGAARGDRHHEERLDLRR